jgi:transcriptional regulator with XRE-family HTH domain
MSRGPRRNRPSDEQAWRRDFGQALRGARQRAGLTQVRMAAALEMNEDAYARYEAGTMWPSMRRLRRLAEVLGCSTDALLAFKRRMGQAVALDIASDSQAVRRVLRMLRQASPETLRKVERVLDALDDHGGLRLPGEPGE